MVSKKISKKRSMCGGEVKEFFLYTTGIGDWGNTNYSLVYIWLNELLPKMISILASSGFNKIYVRHHDIENNGSEENRIMWQDKNMNTYSATIGALLNYDIRTDIVHINSSYTNEALNFTLLKEINQPHLIFDFAHLFNYMYIQRSPKSFPFIESLQEDFSTLNVIYLGYLGRNEGNSSAQINNPGIITNSEREAITLRSLVESNFVKIDIYGNVSTYIDKISEYGLLEDILDMRNRTKLQRSTNRNARANGSFVSSISISNQPVRNENIIINNPEVTIRKIAELTYLDEAHIRSSRPFPNTYIDNVNTYFVNEYMNDRIML